MKLTETKSGNFKVVFSPSELAALTALLGSTTGVGGGFAYRIFCEELVASGYEYLLDEQRAQMGAQPTGKLYLSHTFGLA